MPYTTAVDIKKYYNGLAYADSEGVDSNISEDNVNQFIDEQSVVIDLTIGKKYTLPITDSSDLTYLKIVCDKLVVCQIDKVLRTFAMDDESQFVRRRNYCKEAKEMLDAILDGEVPLSGNQKNFVGLKYNRKAYYDDCECGTKEVSCVD